MINVVVYIKTDSEACARVIEHLKSIEKEIPHRMIVIDVDKDEQMKKAYGDDIPLVQVGPFSLRGDVSRERLIIALGASRDRENHLKKLGDESDSHEGLENLPLRRSERFSAWMSAHYIWVVNIVLVLFLAGAFLAPFFMKIGAEGAARVIYSVYSPFCHQLPFRSWFLYGEQAYYPRALAQIPDVITYEEVSNTTELDLLTAREFIGNDQVGYKTALCQRDIAIFGSMLIFGIFYGMTGRRTKPIKWYLLVLVGVLPMLLDGSSQLKGVLVDELPNWLPLRESTPLLRTITGALFGSLTAWFILPYLDESAQMTLRMITRKKLIGQELHNREDK